MLPWAALLWVSSFSVPQPWCWGRSFASGGSILSQEVKFWGVRGVCSSRQGSEAAAGPYSGTSCAGTGLGVSRA